MRKRTIRSARPEVKVGLVALSLLATVAGWMGLSRSQPDPEAVALQSDPPPAEQVDTEASLPTLPPLPTVVPPPDPATTPPPVSEPVRGHSATPATPQIPRTLKTRVRTRSSR